MHALKFELTPGDRNQNPSPLHCDFRSVEGVASHSGLIDNGPQICADRSDRIPACLKSLQLRVKPVTSRLPEEDFLSEQTFTPKGEQAHAVEQRWVQGPQSHRLEWSLSQVFIVFRGINITLPPYRAMEFVFRQPLTKVVMQPSTPPQG